MVFFFFALALQLYLLIIISYYLALPLLLLSPGFILPNVHVYDIRVLLLWLSLCQAWAGSSVAGRIRR
jgi:hypothetical protein